MELVESRPHGLGLADGLHEIAYVLFTERLGEARKGLIAHRSCASRTERSLADTLDFTWWTCGCRSRRCSVLILRNVAGAS